MKRKNRQPEELYGIIGLGRFGRALAKTLSEYGVETIVVDQNESVVREIRQYTDNAFVTSDLSKESLTEMGFHHCNCIVICIGDRMDTNILTALNAVSLGVPKVIAKAVSTEHGQVLEKIGAEVVYPENDMAIRLAKRLTTNSVLEYISLNNEIEIAEIIVGAEMLGKSVLELNLRGRFGLNIIAIEHENKTDIHIQPDYIFSENDVVILLGKSENIQAFERANK